MPTLPRIPKDAPEGSALAFPGDGRVVYRLVTHDPPSRGDFQPRVGKGMAAALGLSELERIGLSHYLTLEEARPWKTKPESRIASVTLSHVAHFSVESPIAGHVTVWARVEDLVSSAEVVE